MEKSVLKDMLDKKGFTPKRDDAFEKINNALCATADHYSDLILNAIGDIPSMDIPVIIFTLRQMAEALEEVNPKYKIIADIMASRVGTEATVTTIKVERK